MGASRPSSISPAERESVESRLRVLLEHPKPHWDYRRKALVLDGLSLGTELAKEVVQRHHISSEELDEWRTRAASSPKFRKAMRIAA